MKKVKRRRSSTKNKSDYFARACGDRLRIGREALGWSKAEMARQLKISDQRLATYEIGKRRLSPDILQLVFETTKIDAAYLVHGEKRLLPREIYDYAKAEEDAQRLNGETELDKEPEDETAS